MCKTQIQLYQTLVINYINKYVLLETKSSFISYIPLGLLTDLSTAQPD